MATLGFQKVHIGIFDETETITKVHVLDAQEGGAISAKVSGLGAPMNTVWASDVPFYVDASGTGQPTLELNIADIPEDVLNEITGAKVENGIAKIGANTTPPYVAVILETKGTKSDTIYISLLKGVFSYDEVNLATGEDKGKELQTDTITGNFVARSSDALVYAKGRTSTQSFTEEAFKTFVFPGYTAA